MGAKCGVVGIWSGFGMDEFFDGVRWWLDGGWVIFQLVCGETSLCPG